MPFTVWWQNRDGLVNFGALLFVHTYISWCGTAFFGETQIDGVDFEKECDLVKKASDLSNVRMLVYLCTWWPTVGGVSMMPSFMNQVTEGLGRIQ